MCWDNVLGWVVMCTGVAQKHLDGSWFDTCMLYKNVESDVGSMWYWTHTLTVWILRSTWWPKPSRWLHWSMLKASAVLSHWTGSWRVSMATHSVDIMKFHPGSTNLKAAMEHQPPTTSSGAAPPPLRGVAYDMFPVESRWIDVVTLIVYYLNECVVAFMLWWCGCYSDSQHVCLCAAFWLVEAVSVFRVNVCI